MSTQKPTETKRFETAPNTGALFFIDTKASVKHPDAKGKLRIGDMTFSIAGWMRKSQAGKDYISIIVDAELLG